MDEKTTEIYKACLKETEIKYGYGDGFFKPRLAGINHLEVGHSKIISNPVTILLEAIFSFYKNLRRRVQKLNALLFPRRHHIYAKVKDSYVTGRLMHLDRAEMNVPIHNAEVELWARTKFTFQWKKLGVTVSDNEGNFEIRYTLREARNFFIRSIQLEIYQPTDVKYNGDRPSTTYRVYHCEKINKSDLIGLGYSVNTIALPLWEYRTDIDLPRAYFPENLRFTPEVYVQGREDALIQQLIPIELTKQKHLFQIKKEPGMLTLEDIQKDYPENLTLAMEKKLPGYTRGDEWFGFRMMNGMNKASFMPDKDKKGIYHVKFFGAGDYEHNNEYAFPDTDIEFEIHKDKTPLPVAITFTGPLNALNKDPFQTRTFTRNDGEDWLAAKRLARVCGAVCAEVDEHYTGTHVNTEQFAIAAFRNFRKNPVTWILFPHLKEVSLINAGADKTIIGGYLPTATALTTKGLVNRCRDILGVHNWKGWQPMEVINETHTYAKAENLFWNLLGDFMDFFFEKYEKDIKTFWNEVYFFSEDLVNHSVPVFLSELHVEKMNASKKERYERLKEYTHFQFGYHPEHSAEIVHGKSVAMSSITKSKTFTRDEDFNNLKDACRYAIMMATFSHTWINEHQYDDLGEILYSCGGLRFGEKESGVIGPESDPHIAPDLTRSTQMLWFTNFLSRTEYGFITRNEENDIHPYFIELLLKHKDEFMELGVDIESIESRTNI